MCRWAARVAVRLDRDGDLALVPLEHEETARLLASIPSEERSRCWWFVRRDGTPVPGDGGGGVVLLAYLPSTRLLGKLLRAVHASPVVDAMDTLVARHRGRLGKLVPDGPAPHRFP